jgi:hypothetical protein
MQTEQVALEALKPPPRNVRAHPEHQIVELARAVEMFGQTRPIVIDEDNMILAGNGLALAFRRLGRAEITAHRVTGLSEADKTKLLLSDNRIFALGIDDNVAILDTIRGLEDFDIPGFDAEILQRLTLDTASLTDFSMGDYGTLPQEAVERARNAPAPPPTAGGEPAGADSGAGANEDIGEDETICPRCGHVFTPP